MFEKLAGKIWVRFATRRVRKAFARERAEASHLTNYAKPAPIKPPSAKDHFRWPGGFVYGRVHYEGGSKVPSRVDKVWKDPV